MLEQQHRGALVQIYSLQFCPQFFQGENTQAARPYSTKHPPKMFPLPFYLLFFILSKIHSTKHNLCLQGPTTHHSRRKCYHISNREEKKVQKKKNNKGTREERHKITSCNILLKWPPTLPISNEFLMFLLQVLPLK